MLTMKIIMLLQRVKSFATRSLPQLTLIENSGPRRDLGSNLQVATCELQLCITRPSARRLSGDASPRPGASRNSINITPIRQVEDLSDVD